MKTLSRIGGAAALLLAAYSLATIAQVAVLGGPPHSAAEMLDLLHRNRLIGLLRLDLPSFVAMPFYVLMLVGLWAAMKHPLALLAVIAGFVGLGLILSVPTPLSMVPLADQYAAASGEARVALLNAGDTYLANDLWHNTRAVIGGFLIETGAFAASLAMLKTGVFHRSVAWLGLFVHGIDAIHLVLMPVYAGIGGILLMVAGPFYPVWLALVGYRLLKPRA